VHPIPSQPSACIRTSLPAPAPSSRLFKARAQVAWHGPERPATQPYPPGLSKSPAISSMTCRTAGRGPGAGGWGGGVETAYGGKYGPRWLSGALFASCTARALVSWVGSPAHRRVCLVHCGCQNGCFVLFLLLGNMSMHANLKRRRKKILLDLLYRV
jgi:hypothetical protein